MNTNDPWLDYLPYKSLDYCKEGLIRLYEDKEVHNAKEKGYHNSVRLSHYLTHGEAHITAAQSAAFSLKPLLLFYGLAQLLKASLLIRQPDYPATSQMLSHGLSTRKRKKQHFHYLNDSIKIQKNGLFPEAACHMFHMEPQEGKVLLIRDLMLSLPSLHPMVKKLYKKEVPGTPSDALPELLVQYCLLYHLSMISRYETEWWYEQGLQGSTREHILIIDFLIRGPIQIPFLIQSYLFSD